MTCFKLCENILFVYWSEMPGYRKKVLCCRSLHVSVTWERQCILTQISLPSGYFVNVCEALSTFIHNAAFIFCIGYTNKINVIQINQWLNQIIPFIAFNPVLVCVLFHQAPHKNLIIQIMEFWSAVYTRQKEPQQEGKQTWVCFKWTKACGC